MYPKKVKLFIPWSKAMVAGATVDKPSYDSGLRKTKKVRKRRRRRRKKGMKNGSQE